VSIDGFYREENKQLYSKNKKIPSNGEEKEKLHRPQK